MTAGMIYCIVGVPQVGYTPNNHKIYCSRSSQQPVAWQPRAVLPSSHLSLATRFGEQEKTK